MCIICTVLYRILEFLWRWPDDGLFRLKHVVISEWNITWLSLTEIRGMFKKRQNFLNNAPTSIKSVLRLLSAPSARFWQQTAICPVSLWALVVELHPLKWAHAQAVRQINDKVTMKELEERECVKFCCKLGKNLQRHFNCLTKHTGKNVWDERSAMSGLSILKGAECWSVKIPGLNDLPHQQMMTMSRVFVLWFTEIVI